VKNRVMAGAVAIVTGGKWQNQRYNYTSQALHGAVYRRENLSSPQRSYCEKAIFAARAVQQQAGSRRSAGVCRQNQWWRCA